MENDAIDSTKLTLSEFIRRVPLGQLISIAGTFAAACFSIGYLLSGHVHDVACSENKVVIRDDYAGRITKAEQDSREVQAKLSSIEASAAKACEASVQSAAQECATKVDSCKAGAQTLQNRLDRCNAAPKTPLTTAKTEPAAASLQAGLTAKQTDLTMCTNEKNALLARVCFPRNSYYINTRMNETSNDACIAKALRAATKLNVVGTMFEKEVHLVTQDGYFCAVGCGRFRVVSCNGNVYASSRVYADRLQEYIDD